MTIQNDNLVTEIMKGLERWRLNRARPAVLTASDTPDAPAQPTTTGDLQSPPAFDPAPTWPPTLGALLERVAVLPPCTITLGGCDDGLPFLLDLTYPAPGSLLAWGQAGSGKQRWLRGVFASALVQNAPEEVLVSLITPEPPAFCDLAQSEGCQEVLAPDDPAAADLIDELAWEIEQRKRGVAQDPVLLLLIDDLAALQGAVDGETFERLCRIVRHGPRSRVWTIATMRPEAVPAVPGPSGERALDALCGAFRTHLVGQIDSPHLLRGRIPGEIPDTRRIEPGIFFTPYGNEWIPLWACAEKQKGNEQ